MYTQSAYVKSRPTCYFPQCGIIASVAVLHGDPSRIRGVTPPESNPRTPRGGVGQGFGAALTAREGHQSRTAVLP